MPQSSLTWNIEPHTIAKHAILQRYLKAWLPILSYSSGRAVYIDAFAGPGLYSNGQKGSPLIALDTLLNSTSEVRAHDFTFVFIEKDADRCEHLDSLVTEYRRRLPHVRCEVICGAFDETMTIILDILDSSEQQLAPTFLFADPFGYSHTPMSTIARFMSHPKCEVLVNFMYEDVNRFITHPNEAHSNTIDKLFGSREWRNYEWDSMAPRERERAIHDLYQHQLNIVGGAQFVRSFRMINRGNRTDYYLFFGTNHPKGLDKMKESMWRVDTSGGVQFSDCTDPRQAVLFAAEPDFTKLQQMILARFGGTTATVKEVGDFVICETPFYSSHYKKHALRPLELEAGRIHAVGAPATRRAGTYGDPSLRLQFD